MCNSFWIESLLTVRNSSIVSLTWLSFLVCQWLCKLYPKFNWIHFIQGRNKVTLFYHNVYRPPTVNLMLVFRVKTSVLDCISVYKPLFVTEWMAIYNMTFIVALLLCCVLICSGVKNNPSLFLENLAILCLFIYLFKLISIHPVQVHTMGNGKSHIHYTSSGIYNLIQLTAGWKENIKTTVTTCIIWHYIQNIKILHKVVK
jgi:hypothetical protein